MGLGKRREVYVDDKERRYRGLVNPAAAESDTGGSRQRFLTGVRSKQEGSMSRGLESEWMYMELSGTILSMAST